MKDDVVIQMLLLTKELIRAKSLSFNIRSVCKHVVDFFCRRKIMLQLVFIINDGK